MKTKSVLAILCAAGLFSCAPKTSEVKNPPPDNRLEMVTIEGHVYIAQSQTPIVGAFIATSLDGQTAQTDGSGYFLLKTNTKGRGNYANKPYTIAISAPGYVSFNQNHIWGDNPTNQVFSLMVYDPYAFIKELGAPIVEREFKNYLSRTINEAPDVVTGQPLRDQELQRAFSQENVNLRASHTEENQKFFAEKEKDSQAFDQSLKGKDDAQRMALQKQFNAKWEGKKQAKAKKQENEQFFLKGRQMLERKQMKSMFVLEKEKVADPDSADTENEKGLWEDYMQKHALPSYLIALGKGSEPLLPSGSISLKVEPQSIDQGQSAKLIWEAWNTGKEIVIEPGIGKVTGQRMTRKKPVQTEADKKTPTLISIGYGSSINITPDKTTVYKIKAKDWNGKELEASVEIKVTEVIKPPPPDDTVRHEPPQNREIAISAVCEKGQAPYLVNTSWNPKSVEVNQGDAVHLTVFGPPVGSDDACYSVSFIMDDFNVWLPKITKGSKQETMTFQVAKFGKFSYRDSERDDSLQPQSAMAKTTPGFLIVNRNTGVKPTGICVIRDANTSLPPFNSPNVWYGYAKIAVPEVNDLDPLKNYCTSDVYADLIKAYLKFGNQKPVQEEVAAYSADGSPYSTTCGKYGCDYINVVDSKINGLTPATTAPARVGE